MKGIALSTVLTVVFVVVVAVIVGASLFMSVFAKSSEYERIVNIQMATEQPLSIVNGLLQTRLLDGRMLFTNGLHALGGARLMMPPLANRALQSWQIDMLSIAVEKADYKAALGTSEFVACSSGGQQGYCAFGSCADIPGSSTVLGASGCGAGQSCCREEYNFTERAYNPLYVRGTAVCGPVDGYYGVCEPGGCSFGRKDMGTSNCPDIPIGNHCCRPFTYDESNRLSQAPFNSVAIPLLYPGLIGTMTIKTGLVLQQATG